MSYGCIKCPDCIHRRDGGFPDGCTKRFPAETPVKCSAFRDKSEPEFHPLQAWNINDLLVEPEDQ